MAVNGLGANQQIQIANTFQPGTNSGAVKNDDDKKPEQSGFSRGTESIRASKEEADKERSALILKTSPQDNNEGASQKRGSLVDITV